VIASYIFSPSKKGTIHENLARLIFPPTATKVTDEEGKTIVSEIPATTTSLSLKDLATARPTRNLSRRKLKRLRLLSLRLFLLFAFAALNSMAGEKQPIRSAMLLMKQAQQLPTGARSLT
jgi:hypothetical protein